MSVGANLKTSLVMAMFLLILASPAQGRTIYVDDDGAAEFDNIQAAINDSNDGDTIIVADGTYTGDGNRDIDFKGKAITVRSENGPQNCVVDSEGAWLDSHRAFYFHSGEGPSSVLDGLTIIGGHVYNENGGGILSLSSSPTIRDCIIRNNDAEFAMIAGGAGGGIFLGYSDSLILNCTVIDNRADAGGGICCGRGNPTISNCLIRSNGRSGIECYQSSAKISRCVIEENSGGGIACGANTEIAFCHITGNYNGSGIACGGKITGNYNGSGIACGGNTIIRDCLIANNATNYAGHSVSGGGIWCGEHSNPIIINCTIADNHAEGYGGGIGCYWTDPTVINTILWGNSALYSGPQVSLRSTGWPSSLTISFSNVQGGTEGIHVAPECILLWGEGNIEGDPNFADPNNGNYHLKSQAGRWDPDSETWVTDGNTSPCIDAGNPGCPVGDEPAPNGNRRNMGAYGGTAEASKSPANWRSIADLTNDWTVDFNDLKVFVDYWLETGRCIPSDLTRNQSVDFADFALMAFHWLECTDPECGVQVTDVKIIRGELEEGWFRDIEEVDEVRVGDIFIVEIEVSNFGSETEHVLNLYGWDLSPENCVEVIGYSMPCVFVYDLQPGESAFLLPFCISQAFEAQQDGRVTMNIYVKDWVMTTLCGDTFTFEVLPAE